MDKISTQKTLNHGRILIVEDDPEIIAVLCDFLLESGYDTVGHTSGEEALKTLSEQKFDLLLTDLMIPEMDGVELLQLASKMDPYLVGILLTGHDSVRAGIEARRAGAFDYILKPFKLHDLQLTVCRGMEARRSSANPAAV